MHDFATSISNDAKCSSVLNGSPPGRRRLELEASANRAFRLLPCEAVPAEAARIYAKVKAAQQMQGLSLDENDLWIAATTLSLSATLVTADSDFLSIQRSENGCDHYALAPALQVFLCGCAPFREKDLISNHKEIPKIVRTKSTT